MRKPTFSAAIAVFACLSLAITMAFAQVPARKAFGKGNPFAAEELPAGQLKNKLQSLNPTAKEKAMTWLHTMDFDARDAAEHLRVDNGGGIFIVCPDDHGNCEGHSHAAVSPQDIAGSSSSPEKVTEDPATHTDLPVTANAAVVVSSPPVYHSRPSATRRIYLDFNGGIVAGTAWNTSSGVTSYNVKVWTQDTDSTTFNDAEQAWMKKVWQRVAEDYSSFDVDVTTDVAYDPDNYTGNKDLVGWLLICETTDNNGVALPHNGSGGVAYVNVFGGTTYSPNYQPAWVSSTNGGGSESIIAEAASHEMGHNMGLNHDATSTLGYYGGHGSGDISWGPIMGTGYNRNVSQWSKGEYFDANNIQDDLAVIAGKVSYRTDDHGNTLGTATPLVVTGGTSIASTTLEDDPANAATANKGVIERNTDVDVFSFVTGAGTVTLNANPWKQPSGTFGGNLDILLELYNEAGTLVTSNNAADKTLATITTTLAQGLYYLYIRNTGTGTPTVSPPSGYTSYGSVGEYFISGTISDSSGFVVAPVAEGQFTNLTQSGQSSHQFTVIYSDNVAIDVTTIGSGDLQVTGPGGYSQLAQLVSLDVATNGTPRSATYAVTPTAGGNWLPAQNGSYIVSLLASQVKDTEGAFVAAGTLGQFSVAIPSALYSADMTANPGWTLGTGWAYGTPTYSSGTGPTTGYTGTKILAVNLAGNYAKGLTMYATTPVINASGTTSLTLSFRRWLGLKNNDTAKIEVSTNGSAWIPVWSTTAAVTDSGWQLMTYALPAEVVGSATLQLRWGLISLSGQGNSPTAIGWNIDDVEILAGGGADAIPPTASLSVGNIVDGGSPSHSCSVTYADSTAVLLFSLDATDLLVVGPSGPLSPLTVDFTGADLTANGSPMTGSYSIAAPGGTWDSADNGTYTITLQDAAVADTPNNLTAETVLGTFTVNISNLTPGMLLVTPAGNLSASGTVGGPFSPASLQYTLNNSGQTALNWTASKTASWVTLSAPSGTLAAGASTTVTVAFATAANSLAAGSYTDIVSFSNTTSNNGNTTRNVSLTVVSAGVLAVTTAGGLSSSGNYGGPFSPSSQQYTLNNTGGSSINWTASKTATWVGLSAPSGTLAAGASTTVTVSFATAANSLAIGSYNDTVSFANTTNNNGNTTRGVALTVNAIPVTVTLSNLSQSYNGSIKPVTVTTNPTPVTHSVTYGGSSTVPTNAGTYAVVATITQPNYSGSASGSLVIAKAAQTITFASLATVSDTAAPFTLGATASSGLTVSYTSSNTSVATVSGNTVTIFGVGSTTITASQSGNSNYNVAPEVLQTLTVADTTPPTLASTNIVDDKSGGPVVVNTLVSYTVTFSEDMNASTVTAAVFGNEGSSTVAIDTVTETSPNSGVFIVPVTPTSAGTLQLKVNANAVLKDVAGNNLVTTSAIFDNTTITVQSAYDYWSGGATFNADANNDGVANGMAWLLGATNKDSNAISLLPTFDNTTDANYFIFTYRRSDAANTDPSTTIVVEYGNTLSGWASAVHDGTNIIITPTDNFYGTNPGIDKVQVKINRSLAPSGKLFCRLKAVYGP